MDPCSNEEIEELPKLIQRTKKWNNPWTFIILHKSDPDSDTAKNENKIFELADQAESRFVFKIGQNIDEEVHDMIRILTTWYFCKVQDKLDFLHRVPIEVPKSDEK